MQQREKSGSDQRPHAAPVGPKGYRPVDLGLDEQCSRKQASVSGNCGHLVYPSNTGRPEELLHPKRILVLQRMKSYRIRWFIHSPNNSDYDKNVNSGIRLLALEPSSSSYLVFSLSHFPHLQTIVNDGCDELKCVTKSSLLRTVSGP